MAIEHVLNTGEYENSRHAFANALCTIFKVNTPAVALKKIAELASCSHKQVCIFSHRTINRNGKHIPVIYMNFYYNEDFNDVLKQTGQAKFDYNRKSWNLPLPLSENTAAILRSNLQKFFHVIIDMETTNAYKLLNPKSIEKPTFRELYPSQLKFNTSAIMDAIIEGRPSDNPVYNQIYMFNGNSFEKLDPDDYVTRHQLLLIRYAVEGGSPRYMLLHCLEPDDANTTGETMAYFGMAEYAFYNERSVIASLTDEITQRKLDSCVPLFSKMKDVNTLSN